MSKLILRRLLEAVPLLFLVSVGVFVLIHAVPGGPLTVYLSNPQVRPEDIARLERALGLDRPVWVQYGLWLANFITGDWGFSFADGRPVLTRILERMPATMELMGAGFLISAVIALPLGVGTAISRSKWLDHAATLLAFVGISMPVYWMGLMLQLGFGLKLGWLPISGRFTPGGGGFGDHLLHLILPATALAFAHVAVWSRYLRSSMVDSLAQPYMRTAEAKGLRRIHIVWRHAFRNALLPVVTVVALDMAFLVSGAVITESIFAWPGVGSLFIDSVSRRDYTVIMGVLMIGASSVILFNMLADILYAWIDPRVHFEAAE